MKDTSVLIYSCDAYSDVWEPFFTLFYRYWECPYRVYITCETKKCYVPGVTTINTSGSWTERMHEAVKQIPTKYVIGMCEDMFMRRRVHDDVIETCIERMEQDKWIANFNFEKEYDWTLPSKFECWGKKPYGNHYQKSCQPTLWRRAILMELLSVSCDAWQWEMSPAPDCYDYYIWTGDERDLVFEYGYHNNQWFGIQKGRWDQRDVVPLFEREHIEVDYSIRGYI